MLPIYIIHWNAPNWLSSSVSSLLTSDIDIDIHVVDNGPDDAPLDHLSKQVRVLKMPRNVGYTGGANAAIRDWLSGTEPFAVVASHDLHVEPDTFRRLLNAMGSRPELGIVGPYVIPGGTGDLVAEHGDLELRTWISGSCFLLRRQCAEQVGWFDEDYGSYVEDVDYCFRAIDHGWQVGRLMSAQARGLGSGTTTAASAIHRNWMLLDWKRRSGRGAITRSLLLLRKAVRHSCLSVLPITNRTVHRQRAVEYWTGLIQGLRRIWALR